MVKGAQCACFYGWVPGDQHCFLQIKLMLYRVILLLSMPYIILFLNTIFALYSCQALHIANLHTECYEILSVPIAPPPLSAMAATHKNCHLRSVFIDVISFIYCLSFVIILFHFVKFIYLL